MQVAEKLGTVPNIDGLTIDAFKTPTVGDFSGLTIDATALYALAAPEVFGFAAAIWASRSASICARPREHRIILDYGKSGGVLGQCWRSRCRRMGNEGRGLLGIDWELHGRVVGWKGTLLFRWPMRRSGQTWG